MSICATIYIKESKLEFLQVNWTLNDVGRERGCRMTLQD